MVAGAPRVTLVVQGCQDPQEDLVEKVLWDRLGHQALKWRETRCQDLLDLEAKMGHLEHLGSRASRERGEREATKDRGERQVTQAREGPLANRARMVSQAFLESRGPLVEKANVASLEMQGRLVYRVLLA